MASKRFFIPPDALKPTFLPLWAMVSKIMLAASRVAEKLESRLAEIKNQSASYDAENYALAQKCKVTKDSNYVTLFVSAKHEDMQKIFDSAAK